MTSMRVVCNLCEHQWSDDDADQDAVLECPRCGGNDSSWRFTAQTTNVYEIRPVTVAREKRSIDNVADVEVRTTADGEDRVHLRLVTSSLTHAQTVALAFSLFTLANVIQPIDAPTDSP